MAVETWTEKDQIDITINPVQMLYEFSKYRQRIKQHADAVHLISYVLLLTVTAVSTRVIFISSQYQLGYMSGSSDFYSVAAGPFSVLRSGIPGLACCASVASGSTV